MILLFKLLTVPASIGFITFLEKRLGTQIAGLLGGFPVVAGPILIFLAIENGPVFATTAATSAISAIICLLFFGVSYCWISKKFKWQITYIASLLVWFISATIVSKTAISLSAALPLTFALLACSSRLLPPHIISKDVQGTSLNLLPRMLAGASLTLVTTTLSSSMGATWIGILSMFPVIGSVLAIFIHRTKGANQVTTMYLGMIRGLYSSAIYFFVLALLLPITGIAIAVIFSLIACISVQFVFNAHKIFKWPFKP